VDERDRAVFDGIMASRGRINAPQSMLMYAPKISARASSLNDALRELLSESDFEVAVLSAAREFNIDYVWAAHVPAALRAGVSADTIETIRTRRDLSALGRRERACMMGRQSQLRRLRMSDPFPIVTAAHAHGLGDWEILCSQRR
jgi:4-carboxymuconolactone decarboxylase